MVARLGRRRLALAVAGILVAGVVVAALVLRRAGSRTGVEAPAAAPADTAPAMPPGAAVPDSQPAGPATGSALPAAPSPAAARVASPRQGVRRYARTWANVRETRGRGAPSVRVLDPGEAVLVDSLRRGWYRVLADGQVLGYVHRSNLDAVPPTARP